MTRTAHPPPRSAEPARRAAKASPATGTRVSAMMDTRELTFRTAPRRAPVSSASWPALPPAATRPRGRSTACVFSSVQSSVGSWLLGGALAALLPSFRHYAHALTLTLPFARQRLAEKTCDDTDGSSTAAVCGTDATCSEGVTGDGYTCECDDGYSGADVSNGAATCTGEQCFVARSAACRHTPARPLDRLCVFVRPVVCRFMAPRRGPCRTATVFPALRPRAYTHAPICSATPRREDL